MTAKAMKTVIVAVVLMLSSVLPISAQIDEARSAYEAKRYADAWLKYRPLAEQGNAEAEYYVAIMLSNGEGVKEDLTEANVWLNKAAEHGHIEAQLEIGLMASAAQNHGLALFWFQKAAGQGDVKAQFNLGVMYRNGKGVLQNDHHAMLWLRKAAEQGLLEAQIVVGDMYAAGRGVEKDETQAIYWLRKAALQGHARNK